MAASLFAKCANRFCNLRGIARRFPQRNCNVNKRAYPGAEDYVAKHEGFNKDFISEVEESREEFIHVEKLLPKKTVPDPPRFESYPTPSGWTPPADNVATPYFVNRTRNHMLPIYLEQRDGNSRKFTRIKFIDGDIWALEKELREFLLQFRYDGHIYTQVHEVTRSIRVHGIHLENVTHFLLQKGF